MDSLERAEHLREWSSWELAEYTVELESALRNVWNLDDNFSTSHPVADEVQFMLRHAFVEDSEGRFGEYRGYDGD